MTLLVGIRCKDGVVVAADQAVTFGTAPGRFTISHRACKISVLHKQVIVAGTGHVGMNQRFCETISSAWTDKIAGKKMTPVEVGRELSREGIADFQKTGVQPGSLGALVAFPNTKGGPQLCELQVSDFQPELKDIGTWFVSMGSGQAIADPYLAFMREVFWSDGMPPLSHGLFAAAWVMRQSIRVAPGWIAEPIDIAMLTGDKAKMLDADELQVHFDAADAATKHFGTFSPESLPPAESVAPIAPVPIPSPGTESKKQ